MENTSTYRVVPATVKKAYYQPKEGSEDIVEHVIEFEINLKSGKKATACVRWKMSGTSEMDIIENKWQVLMLSTLLEGKSPKELIGKEVNLLFVSLNKEKLGRLYGVGKFSLYIIPATYYHIQNMACPRKYLWEDEVIKTGEEFEERLSKS